MRELIRPLRKDELDEAADLASSSLSSDTDAKGKRIYPWSAGESKPYYERIFNGIFGKPSTHLVGLFLDGKLAGVIYTTSLGVWLEANPGTTDSANATKTAKLLKTPENKIGYIGGLAVKGELKGKGCGTRLLAEEIAYAEKNFGIITCYVVEGSKSKAMVEKRGFKKILTTDQQPPRHWFSGRKKA